MAKKLTYKAYKQMVEEQATAMLDSLAFIATGSLDTEIEIPEGIDILSDLAVGISYLVDDIRLLLKEQEEIRLQLEQRVAERTAELEHALAEARAIQARYVRQEWESYTAPNNAIVIDGDIEEDEDLWQSALIEAITAQKPVVRQVNGQSQGATLALPVSLSDEMIGVLGFNGEDVSAWHDEDITAVETVVEQVGLALENQRLFDKTQTALSETASLYQASRALNEATTFTEILEVLLKHTTLGNEYQQIALNYFDRPWTRTQEPNYFETIAYLTKRDKTYTSGKIKLADFPGLDRLVSSDEPKIIENIAKSELPEEIKQIYIQGFGSQGMIFLPLTVGGQWHGFINVLFAEPITITEQESSHMMAIANQIAVATQSLHLLEQANARAKREELLRSIAAKVRSSADIDTIMKTAVKEIGEALGRQAFVYLDTENNKSA